MAIRKSLAVLLSALMLTLGAPIVGMAQTQGSTLRGQVVDAGGRGSVGMRVELVSDRIVVSTTISGPDGHFSFSGVPADNYVVRTTVNGQPSGVRVSVIAGQQAQHALIVLPSVATASPAVIAVVGLNGLVSTMTVAASAVAGEVLVSQRKKPDGAKIAVTRQKATEFIARQISDQLRLTLNEHIRLIQQIQGNVPEGNTVPLAPVTIVIPGGGTVVITASGTQ